jgi:hypothetical protein
MFRSDCLHLQNRKFSFLVVMIFLCGSCVSNATGVPQHSDAQEPTLLLMPLNNFVDLLSIGAEGGNAQQELLSENGEHYTDNSTFTYSVSLARKYGENLFVGARFGPSGIPLVLLSVNLNIQYDVLRNDFCKFSVAAMYGGIIYPGPRYGAGVLGSCFFKAWGEAGAVFLSYQSLVDKKLFDITDPKGSGYYSINYIEADIKYNIALLGVEYNIPFNVFRNSSVLIAIGLQTFSDTKVTYEDYVPSGYAIGNGSWSALEFRTHFP